jgi:transglutaminase-like putative cysteine protease
MPTVSIRHRTSYRYRNPVAFGEHRMMLRPAEGPDQRLLAFDLDISPTPAQLRQQPDLSDAWISVARFDARADHLVIESRASIDHAPTASDGSDVALDGAGFAYDPDEAAALAPSLARRVTSHDVDLWARRFLREVGRTRAATVLSEMTHAIRSSFEYEVRLAGPPQTPAETLARRRGSCRDFAVLMADAARSLGLAARFASGYVYGKAAAEPREKGGHTHAWTRVFLPDAGWLDFDPTNGVVGAAGLIRVAAVADPRLATPLHGAWRGLARDGLGMEVDIGIRVEDAAVEQPSPPLRIGGTG